MAIRGASLAPAALEHVSPKEKLQGSKGPKKLDTEAPDSSYVGYYLGEFMIILDPFESPNYRSLQLGAWTLRERAWVLNLCRRPRDLQKTALSYPECLILGLGLGFKALAV